MTTTRAGLLLSALAASDRSTPLQVLLSDFYKLLAAVHDLQEDERTAFAEIGARAFWNSLGGSMVVAEAERITWKTQAS